MSTLPLTLWIMDTSEPRIQPVKALTASDKTYFGGDRYSASPSRHARKTQYAEVYDTFDEAKAACVGLWRERVQEARGALERAQGRLADAEAITVPQ